MCRFPGPTRRSSRRSGSTLTPSTSATRSRRGGWKPACGPTRSNASNASAQPSRSPTAQGVDIRRGDAVETVAALVAEAAASGHPVVTTSWVLNYFSAEARWQFVGALDRAAESVDLSWVYVESPALCPGLPGMPAARQGPKQPTAVVLVRWRDGRRDARHVADAHPHGRWLHWR